MELKEREERKKRNVIVKRVQKKKGNWRYEVEIIFKDLETEVKIEEMRRIRIEREGKGNMIWIKLEKVRIILGGDFNVKTEEFRREIIDEDEKEEKKGRRSKK